MGRNPVRAGSRSSTRHAVVRSLTITVVILLAVPCLIFLISCSDPETVQDIPQTLNQTGSTGDMNRALSQSSSIVLILIIPFIVIVWLYNNLIGKEERTLESWAQVEASYQRRADLIPALVETVSKYIQHERNTLSVISEVRAATDSDPAAEVDQLLQAQNQAAELLRAQFGKTPTDEAMLADLAKAQAMVGKSARQLLAVAESYPQLRASDQFLELQAQFEGTENRILTARSRFNEAVEEYNGAIRKLPGSLIAGLAHLQRKAYFRADAGSNQAPERQWN